MAILSRLTDVWFHINILDNIVFPVIQYHELAEKKQNEIKWRKRASTVHLFDDKQLFFVLFSTYGFLASFFSLFSFYSIMNSKK